MTPKPFTKVFFQVVFGVICWLLSVVVLGFLLLGGLDMFMRNQWQEIWDLDIVPAALLLGVCSVVLILVSLLRLMLKRRQVDN